LTVLEPLLEHGLKYIPTPKPTTLKTILEERKEMIRSVTVKVWCINKGLIGPNNIPIPNPSEQNINPLIHHKFCKDLYENTGYEPEENLQLQITNLQEHIIRAFDIDREEIFRALKAYTPKHNLTYELRDFIYKAKKMPELKKLHITSADKNLGVVIMTHLDYLTWTLKYFKTNANTYILIDTDIQTEILNIKQTIVTWTQTMLDTHKNNLTEKVVKQIKLIQQRTKKRTSMNKFYACPKLHKTFTFGDWGVRPICSNSGSIVEPLSIFLNLYLQPLLKNFPTILHYSREICKDLPYINSLLQPNDILVTSDASALYTNIKQEIALPTIKEYLIEINHPWTNELIEGLKIIMENNLFEFGDINFKQVQGTAMGTSVAVTYANLYLAIIEKKAIALFSDNIIYYRRYIDDIVMVYRTTTTDINNITTNKEVIQSFFIPLQISTGQTWNTEISNTMVIFADLQIIKITNSQTTFLYTKTYQKDLNLYQYIKPTSAHTNNTLEGLIIGNLQTYKWQNTYTNDFNKIVNLFYNRLKARGYSDTILDPIFSGSLKKLLNNNINIQQTQNQSDLKHKAYYKTFYNPQLDKETVVAWSGINKVREVLDDLDIQIRPIICFKTHKNLKDLLTQTRIDPAKEPKASILWDTII
jgi:hypothetical protein